MNQEIKQARKNEVIMVNVMILLLAVLAVSFVYLQINITLILHAIVAIVITTSIRRIWFSKSPITFFQWQKTIVAHERFQFGERDWVNRVNFDAWFKIVIGVGVFFLAWRTNTENVWVFDQGFLTFAFIATAVMVVGTNYSVISKGRTIDTLNGEKESGIQFEGKTLKLLLGIWSGWVLVLATMGLFIFS